VRRRLASLALSALALGALGGCGGGDAETGGARGGRPLVVYGREGGIRFESSRLVVGADGVATLRSEGCAVRFQLETGLWRHLREEVVQTNLAAITGDYPAAPGAGDTITEAIAIGSDEVRIEDFTTLPPEVQHKLSSLLELLGEALREGQRHLAAAC
jgi:hypothetical protein